MGLTITLEGENGNNIYSISEALNYSFLEKIDFSKYKLIKYLDSYGDTVFNHLQMEDLITDFALLEKEIINQKELIKEIIQLAQRCKDGIHTYLKFYGD